MKIKKTLDNMPRLVFWRVDDLLVFLLPFTLGILFGSIVLVGVGFVSVWLYRKIRKRNREINLKAYLYWTLGKGFSQIPSYMRRMRS